MTALGPLLYRIWGGGPGRKGTGAGVLGPTFLLSAQVRKGARAVVAFATDITTH